MENPFKAHSASLLGQVDRNRSLAIDAFRGITITAMILVNNPGSWSYVYAPLSHARWHGWTPTDLIFPFFLFIAGLSLSFTLFDPHSKPKGATLKKALNRAAKLFGLGLFLAIFAYNFLDPHYNWWSERVETIRIMGVLQRIGLAFFFTVLCLVFIARRCLFITGLGLLAFYAGLMLYFPADAAPAGDSWAFGANFSAWLDHTILGSAHNYYADSQPYAFDPEGILGTIPATVTCISGYLTGCFLRGNQDNRALLKLCGIGIAAISAAYALSPIMPINKALWTPSYVLLTSGLGMLTLSALIVIIDRKGYRLWTAPFIVFGANAIAFYMFSMMLARMLMAIPIGGQSLQDFVFSNYLAPIFGPYNGSLAWAFLFLLISYAAMLAMYKRQIFWKV